VIKLNEVEPQTSFNQRCHTKLLQKLFTLRGRDRNDSRSLEFSWIIPKTPSCSPHATGTVHFCCEVIHGFWGTQALRMPRWKQRISKNDPYDPWDSFSTLMIEVRSILRTEQPNLTALSNAFSWNCHCIPIVVSLLWNGFTAPLLTLWSFDWFFSHFLSCQVGSSFHGLDSIASWHGQRTAGVMDLETAK